MKKFLPFKTRKQIQKKYEILAQKDFEVYERAERKEKKEQRRSHFDLQLRDDNLWWVSLSISDFCQNN